MGLWKKHRKDAVSPHTARSVSEAGVAGASLSQLCQETYSALAPALRDKADRFGIWFAPFHGSNDSPDSESFHGRFWNFAEEEEPEEWDSLGLQLAIPPELALGASPISLDFAESGSQFFAGPIAGMRRALWVPVFLDGQLHGALFAASRNSAPHFPLEEIQRVAAELALVLGFRAVGGALQAQAFDLGEARGILTKLCSGHPADAILQELTNHCFRIINRSRHTGQFVLLGVVPPAYISPASGDSQVDFRWSAGDKLAIRSAISDSTADIWRKAMDSKSVVGQESRHSGLPSEAFRVIAFPLLVGNGSAGVLVVRVHSSLASFATLVRLELFAQFASAALAISAQKQAAGTAELSSFFLQNSSQPAFLLDARLEIISASPSANEIWPHPREPVSSQAPSRAAAIPLPAPAFQLFRPADWQRVSEWMKRVSETGVSREARALSATLHTGQRVRLSAFPFSPAGLFLIVQGARIGTDSVRTRDAAELHTLVEWIDQGVLLFDQHESLRTINPRFAQLFGLTVVDLQRAASLKDLVELIAPRVSDPAHFAESWWAAAHGSEPAASEELRIVHPAPRTLERISRPIHNSAGDRLGRLEIYSDLTPQQLFRSRLHKMERLAALGQNVSGVAHELSNPLTTILGYAERLLRNSTDHGRRAEIQRIFSEADRAVSILRQLLASARESPAPRHPVNVNAVVLRTAELERFQLASEKIHLQLDLAPALPPVLADSGQLQQILMNLISNARHALLELKRPGTIFVRTSVNQSSRVLLEVSDTGPGVPEAHRHHIFDPFFTTKPPGIGTGLGLSIVMGLVRQNDGNIRMQSPPGKGATFLIDFPAIKEDLPTLAPQLPPALSVPPPVAASGRVLVVEDEPTVAQLIADMLADLGFTADVLQDARRALVAALNRGYALIICDMKMPVLDGQHFYRALAEAGSPLASRFLFVTGDVLGLATQEFLRKHRLPYIAKPFRLEEFSEKVAAVLNQAPAASSAVLANDLSPNNLLSHG